MEVLTTAIASGGAAVSASPEVIPELEQIDVVVEATGPLDPGAKVVLGALAAGNHVVSMNAELDTTVGLLLHDAAARRGAVYTISDGDQPGVLLRHMEFVSGMGFEIAAAVNCKRNAEISAAGSESSGTPTIQRWFSHTCATPR